MTHCHLFFLQSRHEKPQCTIIGLYHININSMATRTFILLSVALAAAVVNGAEEVDPFDE